MAYSFKLKTTYSFEVYPEQVIGDNFENVTVLGIIDRETAETITKITTKHPLVYPYLPDGIPNNPDDYTYLKIRTQSGAVTVIATEWIRENTIVEVKSRHLVVDFPDFDPTKLPFLRELLAANDMPGYTTKFIE